MNQLCAGNPRHNHEAKVERDKLIGAKFVGVNNGNVASCDNCDGNSNGNVILRKRKQQQLKSKKLAAFYCGACCLLMCATILTLSTWRHETHEEQQELDLNNTRSRLGDASARPGTPAQTHQRPRGSSAYLIEPSAANNVIDCGPSGHDHEPRTTLFIVINSRAQNLERRRKLRSGWLKPANVRRELCPPSSSSSSRPPPPWTPSGAAPALPPLEGAPATPPNEWPINQVNRALARGARIGRIEWLFALGQVRGDSHRAELIRRERGQFDDLLVLNLTESYRNMTLKHLATLEWLLAARRAPTRGGHTSRGPAILIKCDDDAQLDLAQMIAKYALETATPSPSRAGGGVVAGAKQRPLLMCAQFAPNSPVARAPPHEDPLDQQQSSRGDAKQPRRANKWALTRAEWPHDTFPAYCSGLAYLASLDLVEGLLAASPGLGRGHNAPLWIDDVYVTGVLLERLARTGHGPRIVKLNAHFCYTRAQKSHRESLEPGLKCMAYEDQETT